MQLIVAAIIMVLVTAVCLWAARITLVSKPRVNKLTNFGLLIGFWMIALTISLTMIITWAGSVHGTAVDGTAIYNVSAWHQMQLIGATILSLTIGTLVFVPSLLIRSHWVTKRAVEREHHARRQEHQLDFPSN